MFIQTCFIRKNTPELRKKVHELGYDLNHGKWMGKYLCTFITKDTNEWKYVGSPEYDLVNNPNIKESIYCGENEELFLAIAALRDDTDKNQWFVWNVNPNVYTKCQYDKFHSYIIDPFDISNIRDDAPNWHKATVSELLEHFKTK